MQFHFLSTINGRIVEAGARHYFTVPGDFTLALLDEFLKEPKLKMIGCCNELNAGYAADGYCRATKGLGVVMGIYRSKFRILDHFLFYFFPSNVHGWRFKCY